MKTLLLLALLSANVPDDLPTFHCDRAEQNFFYDDDGELVFEQWIFWKWNYTLNRHVVQGWRIASSRSSDTTRVSEQNNVIYCPGFKVKAGFVFQSWTQHDPELADREYWPAECRRLTVQDWPVRTKKP